MKIERAPKKIGQFMFKFSPETRKMVQTVIRLNKKNKQRTFVGLQ